MAAPVETSAGWLDTIRSIVSSSYDPYGMRAHSRTYNARIRAFDPETRPEGWSGYWSARYGRVFTRTLERYPPFDRSQREMLESVPRPMNEALEPAASSAEPADREGRRLPWVIERSTIHDLFGWPGLVIGVLLLSIAAVSVAAQVLGQPLRPLGKEQLPNPAEGTPISPLQGPNAADQTRPPNSAAQQTGPVDEKSPTPAQKSNPPEQKTVAPDAPARRGPNKILPGRLSPAKTPRS
jgi:hypothetical protein